MLKNAERIKRVPIITCSPWNPVAKKNVEP
jgi:hypothetical protein